METKQLEERKIIKRDESVPLALDWPFLFMRGIKYADPNEVIRSLKEQYPENDVANFLTLIKWEDFERIPNHRKK